MNLKKIKSWLIAILVILIVLATSIIALPHLKLTWFRFQATELSKGGRSDYIVHFSVDDIIEIFKDLTINAQNYDSMFENNNLAYLRKLNEIYGVKVSLYCYYEDGNGFNLSQATDCFKDEFIENCNWLKVGFHSKNYNYTYAETTAIDAKSDYELVLDELVRICGEPSIETVIRLSRFQGNEESIKAMSECNFGIQGLLSADDERGSYYLSSEQEQLLKNEEILLIDDITYYETDCRIENIANVSEIKEMLQNDLNRIIFTHEYCLSGLTYKLVLEELLLDAMKDGYAFTFI